LVLDVIGQMDQIFARFGLQCLWCGHLVSEAFYLRPTIAPTGIAPTRLQDIQAAVGEFVMRFRQESHSRKVAAQIKAAFDPENLLNPGRIAGLTR
jgi:FAD/FMN-containing dehydrogenase